MLKVVKNTESQIIFEKKDKEMSWLSYDLSNDHLLEKAGRGDKFVKRVRFEEGLLKIDIK